MVLRFLQLLVALAFFGLWPHHSSFSLRGHTVSSSSVSVPVSLFFPLIRIHMLMGRVTWIIQDNLFISRPSGIPAETAPLPCLFCHIRYCSQAPGTRTWTSFGGPSQPTTRIQSGWSRNDDSHQALKDLHVGDGPGAPSVLFHVLIARELCRH